MPGWGNATCTSGLFLDSLMENYTTDLQSLPTFSWYVWNSIDKFLNSLNLNKIKFV